MPEDLPIDDDLVIPGAELRVSASRSGGPGGQHVNTSSTRITVTWSVADSAVLDEAARERLLERLATRLTGAGELQVSAEDSRSQHQNRERARERLAALVREARVEQAPRKRTRPSRAAKKRRVDAKRRRAEVKRMRATPTRDD